MEILSDAFQEVDDYWLMAISGLLISGLTGLLIGRWWTLVLPLTLLAVHSPIEDAAAGGGFWWLGVIPMCAVTVAVGVVLRRSSK